MPPMTTSLHSAIAAVAPIAGLSIGNPADKSTWRIDFVGSATAEQRAAAAAIVTGYDMLAPQRTSRIEDAWAVMAQRLAIGRVTVATSAGTHDYGIDGVTQDNISKACLGVALGITPPTRAWTPKGATASITVTHDDLKAIALAIGNAFDAHVQAYLGHKAAILSLTTADAIAAYDVGTGWPA